MRHENLAQSLGILGDLSQVGIVTSDLNRSICEMLRLGIGPWSTFTFDERTCTDLTYMGAPGNFAFKIALADMPNLMWEIIQPLRGENIYSDFLTVKGDGLHHLLFKCNGLDWEQKKSALVQAGYSCVQSGKWQGTLSFAYFSKERESGVLIEIVDIPSIWSRPVAEENFG